MYKNVDELYTQIKIECRKFGITYNNISDDSLDLIIETYNWLIGNKYDENSNSWVEDETMKGHELIQTPQKFKKANGYTLIYSVIENHLLNLDLQYKDGTEIIVDSVKPAVDQLGEFLEDRYGMKYVKGDNNAT